MGAALFPEWEHEMSDPITEPVTAESPATGTTEPVEHAETPEQVPTDTVEFWKRKAREQEGRAKAHARKLQEIEDRDLTELQLARKEAAATAADLAEMQRQNTLLAKGIPHDLIPPVNATADELGEYADRLLAWRGNAAAPAIPQPRPDQGQGARPLDPKAQEDTTFAAYDAAFFNPKR